MSSSKGHSAENLPFSLGARRYCSRCKDHCEATKQLSVWRLPRVLIVHLKRFSFANFIWRDKINELVTFPLRWV